MPDIKRKETSEMTTIPIRMDDEDFSHLCTNSARWADPDLRQQMRDGRFEVHGPEGDPPSLRWTFAYWIGREYLAVIFAKSFLASRGFDYQVLWDLAEPNQWIILTDYDYIWQGREASVTEMQR